MLALQGDWRRTHSCGALTQKDAGAEVTLMGWVQRRRDHGGVIFIDLRDRAGITQVVFNPEVCPESHKLADMCRSEFVVAVRGTVSPRPEGMINTKLSTGEIEIIANDIRILNSALTPPFSIEENSAASEDIRLKYRYLDLRRADLQRKLITRHNIVRTFREYLYGQGFLDIETPFLTKSTPEGARDYLVPSRVNPGKMYALPQSPQMFKQLLMVAGYERYFQVVKCFRDEDLRADRQPEFTQLDMEMSFIDRDDLIAVIEGMFKKLCKEILNLDVQIPFPRMDYYDAMERYGHDAPDLRFDLHLKTINDLVKDCGFKVFADVAVTPESSVKAMNAKGAGKTFTRKDIDDLTAFVATLGAKGLAYIKINEDGYQSPIVKFLGEDLAKTIVEAMGGEVGDIIFFGAGETSTVNLYMSKLRLKVGRMLNLIDDSVFNFTWILDFPLLEWDKEEKRFMAVHHPFTAPKDEDLELLNTDPGKVRAKAYDLVLNGSEIGGGSIRIHRSDIQQRMFELLGFTEEELAIKFGFFVDALKYGTPPHGGIAFGVDRISTIFTGSDSIRDVIAFPKTQKATCMMSDAPNVVDNKQLKELSIKLDLIEEKKDK